MNFFQGLSRPMRLAGVVLVGIALVAVVIGTVTALSGGNSQNAAPASSAAPPPGPGGPPPTTSPSSAPASTTTTVPPPPATTTQPPAAGTTAPPPAQGGQSDAKWVPVRVYNNSTIKGLAARASDDFRAAGWNITESGNYPYGVIPTTTAYYTPGTDEETAAKALSSAFGMQAEPRFEGIQNSTPGVIVIVTNDYQGLKGKDG
ncbi:MAG TPA: LytR C-terminal domain-containing protein [Amycolatopsis sp.]|uniref:LytR C-terminal domain-containing protein n=1 Tax=Amycolatopsis sp. TaxID=37632 RepID=UPI002B48031F|nr:LytR C-terminal domain-containing protein [Amycolatopsis sp.]HKS45109.1 LytR C-terminal domain-containing protein [Amycolatopsis sp.]